MKKLPFAILLLYLAISCTTSKSPIKDTKTSIVQGKLGLRLDSLLTPYIQQLRARTDNQAGLAIGITKNEKIIYARTFGFANIKTGEKADFHTRFHIASVSKPFTAAAIVKLIQQGKLNLEDKLIDHIPEFEMKGEGYKNITIKHVLTHTSGIPRHVSVDDWNNPVYGPKALDENLKFAKEFELDFEPGSEYNYSNSAFDILGIVVSRASGSPFHEYVRQHILLPAGMTESRYIKPADSLPPHWAVPYSYGLGTMEWAPYPYTEKSFPSSGLQTTLLDMCKWTILHLRKGNIEGRQVLDKEHFELMTSPHQKTPWGQDIGLSWYLQSYLDHPNIMHLGNDTGFEANAYIYPEDSLTVFVMANRDFSAVGRIALGAAEIIFGQEPKSYFLSGRYQFAEAYREQGIEAAKQLWAELQKDTTKTYIINDDDILTSGAILENGKKWQACKEVLEFYNSLNEQSTYSWRLLGNANLNLGDTLKAVACYNQALKINPNYEKAKVALAAIRP